MSRPFYIFSPFREANLCGTIPVRYAWTARKRRRGERGYAGDLDRTGPHRQVGADPGADPGAVDASEQILLVPEHASHQAEVDLCMACGDGASRHAEVLSFRQLGTRVLALTGGAAEVSLDRAASC